MPNAVAPRSMPTSFRLSSEAVDLLEVLTARLSISGASLVEAGLRLLARVTDDDIVRLSVRPPAPGGRARTGQVSAAAGTSSRSRRRA